MTGLAMKMQPYGLGGQRFVKIHKIIDNRRIRPHLIGSCDAHIAEPQSNSGFTLRCRMFHHRLHRNEGRGILLPQRHGLHRLIDHGSKLFFFDALYLSRTFPAIGQVMLTIPAHTVATDKAMGFLPQVHQVDRRHREFPNVLIECAEPDLRRLTAA